MTDPQRKQRTLRVLLAAEFTSMMGTQLSAVAMPWLALQLTGSARDMGLVMAALLAGVAGFGVLGTSIVGRLTPRQVMLYGDTIRGPLVALLPLLYYLGGLTVGAYMAVMFVIGAFYAPYMASQQTILTVVVEKDEALLSKATAALHTATRLSVLLGPLASGVLIAALGAPAVLLLDAASYVTSAVLLRIYLPRMDQPVRSGPRSLGRVIRTLLADRLLACWSIGIVIGELGWQALFALLPVIGLGHGGASVAGLLLAMFGGGACAGTLFVGLLLKRMAARTLAVVGRVAQSAAWVLLLLPLSIPALAGCLLLIGLLNGASMAPSAAVRALRLPAALRVESLTVTAALAIAAGALGWVLAGGVAQSAGLPAIYVGLAALQAVVAALYVFGAVAQPAPLPAPALQEDSK